VTGIPHTNTKGPKADPRTLPPTTIRAKAKEFATQEVAAQKEEFRSLGIMADWDNEKATYRTLGMPRVARSSLSDSSNAIRPAVRDAPAEGISEDGRPG
jgi:hypothetical protein